MESTLQPGESSATPRLESPAERRRAPRIRLLNEVHGQLVGLDVSVTVRDCSATGFSIECGLAFPEKTTQQFEFFGGDGRPPITIEATAVYSRVLCSETSVPRFVTGFTLEPSQPSESQEAIAAWLAGLAVSEGDQSPEDRRAAQRWQVVGELFGKLEDLDLPCQVRDISEGGICIETHRPIAPTSEHRLFLQLQDVYEFTVRGRVGWSRDVSEPGRPRFLSGLQFMHDGGESRLAVTYVVEQILAASARISEPAPALARGTLGTER